MFRTPQRCSRWEEIEEDADIAVPGITGPTETDTDPLGLGATVEYVDLT